MGRFKEVSICTVRAGMILANDIVSEDGQVLFSRGLELTNQNVFCLKKWKVPSVEVFPDNVISIRNPHRNTEKVTNETEFYLFYQETLQAIKYAFETARFSKKLPLHVINKLVDSYIGPLINARGSIDHLKKIKLHCEYTYRHSINVAIISGILGKLAGVTRGQLKDLVTAGLLHDIGKVSVATDILNKPGKLTDQEMVIIRTHSSKGYELLLENDLITEEIKLGVLQHHERIDGSGYPFGLTKNQISYYAKIIAIADTYDAITSDRIYRKKLTPFYAAEIIERQMYRQLDPLLCLKFLSHIKNYLYNSVVLLSNGQEGQIVYQHDAFANRPIVKLSDGTYLDLEKNREILIIDIAN